MSRFTCSTAALLFLLASDSREMKISQIVAPRHGVKKRAFLIIVQWWNGDALPGLGCWAAASAVSTGGDDTGQQQRKQQRSDYGSRAEWMNRAELRAACRLSEAPTSVKGFTWCDVNVLGSVTQMTLLYNMIWRNIVTAFIVLLSAGHSSPSCNSMCFSRAAGDL